MSSPKANNPFNITKLSGCVFNRRYINFFKFSTIRIGTMRVYVRSIRVTMTLESANSGLADSAMNGQYEADSQSIKFCQCRHIVVLKADQQKPFHCIFSGVPTQLLTVQTKSGHGFFQVI